MCLFLHPCFLFMHISCMTEFPWLNYQLLHISTLCVVLHLRVALNNVIVLYDFFFFYFHPSQTLLHRICLAPSKRKREMRGLFPPLLPFSLHPNYIPLLLRLPFPLLRCLFLGGSSPEKILWHVPCLFTRILYRYSVHFPISCLLLSKFPIHSSCATSDPWCLNPVHYTFPTKLKFIFRVDLLLELKSFFLQKPTFIHIYKSDEQNIPTIWNYDIFSTPRLLLLRWNNIKQCKNRSECSYLKETEWKIFFLH